MRVDAHVHVWNPDYATHPDHPLPPIDGTIERLLRCMDEAAVDKAVLVQPINYMFDHTYVKTALQRHPARFCAVALANTTLSTHEACTNVNALHAQGFCGLRINPNFTNGTFRHDAVRATVDAAGAAGMSVCLFARPPQWDGVEWLVRSCPDTDIILDHFAFAAAADNDDDDGDHFQARVIKLMENYPRVFLKTSAWFRVSKLPHPHVDLLPFVQALVEKVGANRLMFGSDFPFVTEEYAYTDALGTVAGKLAEGSLRDVLGDTAARVYGL